MAELTVDQALQQAVKAHKAGQVQEADRLYTAILKAQPKHPDANHNMGVLAVGVGKVEQALPFFKTALEANPATAQFWLSFIDALIKLDRLTDAKAVLDQAKSKGAKGDGFAKLEQRLKDAHTVNNSQVQAPTQDQLQSLTNLYSQGQLQQALEQAETLVQQFPVSPVLFNIQGAVLQNLGQLDQSIEAYSKALAIKPGYADAHNNMGNTLKAQGKLEEAIEAYNKAITIKPDYAEAYYNIGNALNEQGKLEEAIEAYTKAIAIKPNHAAAYNNMGSALQEQDKPEEAIEACKKALAIKPNHAAAYNNVGNALKKQGKLEEAIEAYNKALTIKPDNAYVYNNMGSALQEHGKLEDAIEAFIKALTIKPDYAEACNNMGSALQKHGKLEEAIEAYTKALAIKPDYAEVYNNIGNAFKRVVFKKPNPSLQKIIISLLDKITFVRPSDIARAAISLLKFEPQLRRHLQTSPVAEVMPNVQAIIADLSELPLLLKLMGVCPLPDLELENLFRELRAKLLLSISDLTGSPDELEVQSALALHCFTNEYIYNQSENEDNALSALEVSVKQALSNGDQPRPQSILCLASYGPLYQYDWSSSLLVTDELEDIFKRQVAEPNQEAKLKAVLPVLKEITDEVSSKVRDQYEASPYPRWVNLGLRLKSAHISELVEEIKLTLFDDKIKNIQCPKILIAGCGTGQHSIGTAARFKGSKVLAIDLSLSSLSYAKRKTEELGIQNIDYMQADILDLCKLDRQFDIVESAGVIHHMDNPVAGWRVLTDCLKLGGLMRIGLYSELARQHIVEMRQEINSAGIESSDAAMRSFRKTVMTSDQNHHKKILNFRDFYSLSELKDLLFHVQEHTFTIPQIQNCLSELGLKFCGFETEMIPHFKLANTNKGDPYNLDKWHAYEEANPGAFAGMYQFWCQKIV